jgi:drug/metabolite transporter, DME family
VPGRLLKLSEYNYIPYLFIASAAILWGGIGIFVEFLNEASFSSIEIVAYRVLFATIFLYVYLRLKKPDRLKINIRHIHYFIGTGIFSICFFNWSYFTAIRETSLSVAVVLLYTGPAFVVVMSRIFFKEAITFQKVVALLFTLTGTILVSQLIPGGGSFSVYGIAVGVGAGFGYALYSIFSKVAMKHYSSLTIIFYTFFIATLFIIPISGIYRVEPMSRLVSPDVFWMIVGLGLIPTVFAYLLYTEGLKKVGAGNASITAMTEPVAATMFGVFLFGEVLTLYQIGGIMLVIFSVLLIHTRKSQPVRGQKII